MASIGGIQFLPIGKKLVEILNGCVVAQNNQISDIQIENILKSAKNDVISLLKSLGVTVHENS